MNIRLVNRFQAKLELCLCITQSGALSPTALYYQRENIKSSPQHYRIDRIDRIDLVSTDNVCYC